MTPIGSLTLPVKNWNPQKADPDETFSYIDLSAVDQETKSILGAKDTRCGDAPSRARQLIKAGDVLVSTVRPNLNGVAPVTKGFDAATASTGFCVLRPNPERIDGRFLMQWVKSPAFVADMTKMATGASYPAVSDRIINDSLIPLPASLEEQRRIADILDLADSLSANRRATLARLDEMPQAIFIESFGDPIENPRRFPVQELIAIVDPRRPISYGILMPGPDQSDGVPYVRVVDMKDGGVRLSGIRKTTESISNAFRRSLLKTGDLLMSIRGHVGRMAEVPPELDGANITQDTARLAISGASPIFVRECLRTVAFQRWMAKHTKGVAVQGINLGDIKRMPIILPPPKAQEHFVDQIRAVDAMRSLHREAITQNGALFSALQDRAFRGAL